MAKKIGFVAVIVIASLLGATLFGASKASAGVTLCNVLGDPPDGNCLNGQNNAVTANLNDSSLSSDQLRTKFIADVNAAAGSSYTVNQVGAAYINSKLQAHGGSWDTNLNGATLSIGPIPAAYRCINTAYDPSIKKVVPDTFDCESDTALIITQNGTIVFVLRLLCGNPMGNLDGLAPADWNLTGGTKAASAKIYPGQDASFDSTLRNQSGADATSGWSVYYCYDACGTTINPSGHSGTVTNLAPSSTGTVVDTLNLAIPISSTHTKVCVWITWAHDRNPTSGGASGPKACTTIGQPSPSCGGWTISPSAIEPPTVYTITAKVNYGSAADATYVNSVSNFYVKVNGPGVAYNNTNAPTSIVGGSIQSVVSPGATHNTGTYTVAYGITGSLGDIKCGADLTITGNTFDVSSHPYFSVLGGDVASGPSYGTCTPVATAGIKGWNTEASPDYAGAGSQLGALALGQISTFASSQGTSPPIGLSFANTTSATNVSGGLYGGGFGSLPCVTDYVAAATANASGAIDWTSPGERTYVFNGTAPPIGGQTLGAGARVKIVVKNADAYVSGGINYSPYSDLAHVPQFRLLVSKGNIYINNNVTTLYGFYDAQADGSTKGYIHTCAISPGVISTKNTSDSTGCQHPLTFYGAVSANHIFLERTLGELYADPTKGIPAAPAETIVYTPELWMGNIKAPVSGPGPSTRGSWEAVTSLPPVL